MPKRSIAPEETEVVKIRMTTAMKQKCQDARARGAHSNDADSTFLGYLIAVGLAKYEKSILPHETGEDEIAPGVRHLASGE